MPQKAQDPLRSLRAGSKAVGLLALRSGIQGASEETV